jgi:hypothetical protein
MHKLKSIIAATALAAALGTQGMAQTLDPPAVADDTPRGSITSSLGTTEILISVLALLLIWAAYDQNAEANSG